MKFPVDKNTKDTAAWIWHELVPKSGQCETVQGELLRAVEKLCWESLNNGNANWDDGFEKLLDFLEVRLKSSGCLSSEMLVQLEADTERLRNFEDPYLEDDLYDRLTEAVVRFAKRNPDLIPHDIDPGLHR